MVKRNGDTAANRIRFSKSSRFSAADTIPVWLREKIVYSSIHPSFLARARALDGWLDYTPDVYLDYILDYGAARTLDFVGLAGG